MRAQERIILVGTNGTGKSTFANKIIQAAVAGENRRALAVLPDDSEPIFRDYNELQRTEIQYINQVQNKLNKVYFDNGKLFDDIQKYFRNGVLVLDDARYYTGSIDEGLRKLFIRSRQNNIDIVFICHGLSEIPPSLITFATKIILLNTVDSWQRLKNKIPNPEKFERLVNEVRIRANQHAANCGVKSRARCTCGAAYVKKIIDVKIDLIQSAYE